jgi:uncharacterized Fe-S center protein
LRHDWYSNKRRLFMKKGKGLILSLTLVVAAMLWVAGINSSAALSQETKALLETAQTMPANEATTLKLVIGNPIMTVNGKELAIDGGGTAPVIQDGRALIPVRAVIESLGGSVEWDSPSQTARLSLGEDAASLSIGSLTAFHNGLPHALDVAPIILAGRTMLPIRFIAESFGFEVEWSEQRGEITVSGHREGEASSGGEGASNGSVPVVYMTADISPEGLMSAYAALEKELSGKVAVKISTGEPGGSNFLSPDLIKGLVQSVNGSIVECNTAYGGRRASAAMHYQVAEDHGFTAIAKVDIMDENGSISLTVTGGAHLSENFVGANFENYDSFIILSHFKGHAMGGFGGAIKNMSIGIASSEGKSWIHSAGSSKRGFGAGTRQDDFLESMAEAAKSVSDSLGSNITYINVMNKLSVDCDCNSNPAEPDMHDIGILASLDPVALDKACVDLVYASPDGSSLIERMESRNGAHTLDHAASIGLGSLEYTLASID